MHVTGDAFGPLEELQNSWRNRLDEAKRQYPENRNRDTSENYARIFAIYTNLVVNGKIS